MTSIKQRGLKRITKVTSEKIDSLVICKESKNYETPSYPLAVFSVLFVLARNPWAIQAMKIWLQLPDNVPLYRWMIVTSNILD